MMRTLLALVLVVGLAGTWAVAGNSATSAASASSAVKANLPSVDVLIAQIEDKMKDVRDMTADMKMKVGLAGQAEPMTLFGTMKAMMPGMVLIDVKKEQKELYRMKTIVKGDVIFQVLETPLGAGQEITKENAVVEQGADEHVTVIFGVNRLIVKMDNAEIKKIQTEFKDVPGFKMENQSSQDFIHYLKNEKAPGSTLKVVSIKDNLATFESSLPDGVKREVVVVDLKNGWLVKVDSYNKGMLDGTIELSNIRTNTGAKESDFDYTPPKGAMVIEYAKMLRGQAEEARKQAEQPKAEKKGATGAGQ
jgi:outer membrane lipoprotein-sorting protein